MHASKANRLGIVTDVDDNYNYVWSDRLGPCELRYPHNPDVKFEPGEIIGYIQTKPVQYDQNPLDLTKEDPHCFDDYTIEKTPNNDFYKWRAQVYLTFAPHDSDQCRKTMEKDSYNYLRGIAYAEDFLFLSDQLMMVLCFKKIQYEEGAVYKAYITRIARSHNFLAVKFGSIFLILEKGIEKVTDEQTIQRVLRNCPWYKIHSKIFRGVPSKISQKPTTSNRQNNQALETTVQMLSAQNEQHQKMAQLEAKNRKLEEKLMNNPATLRHQIQLQDQFSKMLAEQKQQMIAQFQALETKFAQMLSTQNEGHRKEMEQLKDGFAKKMAQLEAKNQKLEEKLSAVESKGTLVDAKMEQLQDEFSKKLTEQQKQMMAQFQESLEQKLNEAGQRAQTEKNKLEEIIHAKQQEMEKFRAEMDKNGQQANGSNSYKSKIIANPKGIVWNRSKTIANISECGLKIEDSLFRDVSAIATEGYSISAEHCRKENLQFPGTILYYYEVTILNGYWYSSFGYTDGSKPRDYFCVGGFANSYGIERYGANHSLWLSGNELKPKCPILIAGPHLFGCGLLLNSKNELAVFFTVDGILLGKQIRINPTVDRLYPTVYISANHVSVEANFGDNLVNKPFKFDIVNCPGLVFE